MTISDLPDQRELWVAAYKLIPSRQHKVSAFVETCLPLLAPNAQVLELGCGGGDDAEAFAQAGHTVIATDFVTSLIERNRDRLDLPNLTFETMRIDEPYPYPNASFDAVYAHLTLHYYRDAETREIIREIRRVLRPGGWLMFACKSPQDPAWGKGEEIEPDMFNAHGKIRHFFRPDYAQSLLDDGFTDIRIASHTGKLYRQKSGWITAIARTTTPQSATPPPGIYCGHIADPDSNDRRTP